MCIRDSLFCREILLDGEDVEGPSINEAFIIESRGTETTLSGIFADGSPFSISLDSRTNVFTGRSLVSDTAMLTVTLVPRPYNNILGDVNQDEAVDFSDIAPFIETLASDTYFEAADSNQDGAVNFLDIASFIAILFGS